MRTEEPRFPTRDDIRAALELLQEQLDRRFHEVKTLQDAELRQRDVLAANQLQERDKAVEVLAKTLKQQVDIGDDNLKQRVANQIEQIRASLKSAELLELERCKGLEAQINSVHREIDIEETATKVAIQKADTATEKRFEAVNEFRAQMADQSALFISRREVEALVGANAEKIASVTDRINRNEGRGVGMNQIWGYIVGGIGLLLALYAVARSSPTVEVRPQVPPAIQARP